MTRAEIISKGAPIEPNCFETDREEQWYKVGLYEGACAWHEESIKGVIDLVVKDKDEMLVAVNNGKLTYKLLRLPFVKCFKQGDEINIIIIKDNK